jgi:hypothetical protein
MSTVDPSTQLSITAPALPTATFKRAVYAAAEACQWEQNGISILEPEHRGVDPSIQIALVQMGSAALSALLTGVFTIANARMSSRIVIVGKNGNRMELPGKATTAEIEHCVQILNSEPPKRIEIANG